MAESVCKICRRVGQKLFLKGEKCYSPKCPFARRPYPPGQKGKRRKGGLSEYGKELMEKKKLREFYGLSERQFKNYVKEILKKRGKVEDTAAELIKKLELRLDNVVFRASLASSRRQARQLVSHKHFLVNGRPVNIPSYQVRVGDVISLKEQKSNKEYYKRLAVLLKKAETPSWIKLDKDKIRIEIVSVPSPEEMGISVEVPAIFEFYSR